MQVMRGARMRFSAKVLFAFCLAGLAFITLTLWSATDCPRALTRADVDRECLTSYSSLSGNVRLPKSSSSAGGEETTSWTSNMTRIDCVINDEYTVNCRKDDHDVYLPFSFIAKYFEVYGKEVKYPEGNRFEWHHSYSRVYEPRSKYRPDGVFMSFEHYNVEVRDRVKCISGVEGVPISTQWGPQGYFYPIQIAQYGLSHYSKFLVDDSPRTVTTLDDAEDGTTDKWTVPDTHSYVDNVVDDHANNRLIQFSTHESLTSPGIELSVPGKSSLGFLSLDLVFVNNGSVSVVVETRGRQPKTFTVHYVCSRSVLSVDNTDVYYGIGERRQWTTLTRDIATDFQKGMALKGKKKLVVFQRIVSVVLHGQGSVDNITVSSVAHLPQFYSAANWLVRHQDSRGGWPIMVTRKLASGFLELPPGWYSAMAQGQAMSLLVRAYQRTRNSRYLDAAVRATAIYDITSDNGGVLAKFADKYPWYEEYPTTPSCFVLNGFIYSLIGLYDLKMTASPSEGRSAARLYDAGMHSLRTLLPLFDTGSGSIYDLRHFVLGSPPNLARWDYHTTHINQLLLLATISNDTIYGQMAARWRTYMVGKRALHN